MDIYVKPMRKATLSDKREIIVSDVAEILAAPEIADRVKNMKLADIELHGKKKKNFLISVTDIIKVIKKSYPDYAVSNVGESDTWVQYSAERNVDKAWFKWLKVAFVAVVLFIGSSTAIMSFHTDGQIHEIFRRYYSMFYGVENENPRIIEIPYAIGLGVGIVVFYNHFMGKKITDDPTPIEVEMEQYDRQVTEAMVDSISQGGGNGDS